MVIMYVRWLWIYTGRCTDNGSALTMACSYSGLCWFWMCTDYGCVLILDVYRLWICADFGCVPIMDMCWLWIRADFECVLIRDSTDYGYFIYAYTLKAYLLFWQWIRLTVCVFASCSLLHYIISTLYYLSLHDNIIIYTCFWLCANIFL